MPGPGGVVVSDSAASYRILRKLDQGGMGAVYEVQDRRLDRSAAMKLILRPDQPDQVARFAREAQITSQLEHPNIVPVHELGRAADGRQFFTMKMVRGDTLAKRFQAWRDQGLDAALVYEALTILTKVCDALAFAHSCGVVHRDLKPANIMIGAYGEVLVMDWGIARSVKDGRPERQGDGTAIPDAPPRVSSAVLTEDGVVVGTPAYMSPEQARGDMAALGPACDIFSLGVILYEFLCGFTPAQGKSSQEVISRKLKGQVMPPGRRAPSRGVPPELEAIAMKALALEPPDRYASMQDLSQDLQRYMTGFSVSAARDSFWRSALRLVRRNRRLFTTAAVALVIVLVVSVWAFVRVVHERDAATAAVEARNRAETARLQLLEAETQRMRRRAEAFTTYGQATELLARGRFSAEAVALLRQSVESDPDFVEARFALAEALRADGDPHAAAASYLQADQLSRATMQRPNLQALLQAAFAYDDAGLQAESLQTFTDIERLSPDDPLALVGRSFRCYANLDLVRAREAAERAVAAQPRYWEAHLANGVVLAQSVSLGYLPRDPFFDRVVDELQQARRLARQRSEPALWLAFVLQQQQRDSTIVRQLYDASVEIEPRNARRLIDRAQYRLSRGDADGAAEDARQAAGIGIPAPLAASAEQLRCSLAGDLPGVLRSKVSGLSRGSSRMMLYQAWRLAVQQKQDAVALQVADLLGVRVDGSIADAIMQSWRLFREGSSRAAMLEAERGIALAPYNVDCWRTRIAALARLGDGDGMRTAVLRAADNAPAGAASFIVWLANLAAGAGRRADAVQALERFLVNHPEQEPAVAEALKRLREPEPAGRRP